MRTPVALAVVKLLKHLPPAAARAALPAALQKVANLLKLRLQRIRCAPNLSKFTECLFHTDLFTVQMLAIGAVLRRLLSAFLHFHSCGVGTGSI